MSVMEQIIEDIAIGGTKMSDDKLSSLIKDYLEVDAEIKSNQILADEIRTEIKNEMAERGLEEVEVDSYIVKSRSQLVSVFDGKKFKERFPEIYPLFLKQVSRSQFSIS